MEKGKCHSEHISRGALELRENSLHLQSPPTPQDMYSLFFTQKIRPKFDCILSVFHYQYTSIQRPWLLRCLVFVCWWKYYWLLVWQTLATRTPELIPQLSATWEMLACCFLGKHNSLSHFPTSGQTLLLLCKVILACFRKSTGCF